MCKFFLSVTSSKLNYSVYDHDRIADSAASSIQCNVRRASLVNDFSITTKIWHWAVCVLRLLNIKDDGDVESRDHIVR